MAGRETVTYCIAGHEIRMTAEKEEIRHLDRAAAKVSDSVKKLQAVMGSSASPGKIIAMVALQLAFDLSLADEMLVDAQRLHDELNREKEAVKRLESLLTRVDDALAY
jgi:cell division protein ZapA (FtsZ GTPase activity inhibitor)